MCARTAFRVALLGISVALGSSREAVGDFTPPPNGLTPYDTPNHFSRTLKWSFADGAEQWPDPGGPAPDPPLDNWDIKLNTTATTPEGLKTLTIKCQHLIPPVSHGNDDRPNPNKFEKTLSLSLPSGGNAEVRSAGAKQILHPHDGHYDFFKYRVSLLGDAGNFVNTEGVHYGQRNPIFWSYHSGITRGTLSMTPSYQDGTLGATVGPFSVTQNNQGFGGEIPPKTTPQGDILYPSDYTMTFVGHRESGRTVDLVSETTLSFLGETDTGFEEMDLAGASELFVGMDEFLVPSLGAIDHDLFVAVDLTQWLSFPTSFTVGDNVDIVNGHADSLPGFLVSNTPVGFDPVLGFVTSSPYSGEASIDATIDGKTPEPSVAVLLLAEFFILTLRRRG